MATAAAASSALCALERRDVQRICSGQSIVDLATAVKELVENALDAGASHIEVKLQEFGRDAFEVSDNGAGVRPENYAALARKHFTSKIRHFDDVLRVASFGFRGEALSAICELAASVTVCTRTADEAVGALLKYDASGALVDEAKRARPVGTTVTVTELFKPLAVRHKEFQRNSKKHYAKLLKVLQAYAVSCEDVKISVFNTVAGKKDAARHVVLATQAHQTMGENIANVFGTKFFKTLVHVDLELQIASGVLEKHNKDKEKHDGIKNDCEVAKAGRGDQDAFLSRQERKVVGYVSKVGAGVGRSDNDRQFFFINGRPVDLPKVAKALNEAWRQYEMKHKPACVLDFRLPLGEYDVNVTPDKREAFVKHEAEIVDAFKSGLNRLYEPSLGKFTVQPLFTTFAPVAKAEASTEQSTSVSPHDPAEQLQRVSISETDIHDEGVLAEVMSLKRSHQNGRNETEVAGQFVAGDFRPKVDRAESAGSMRPRNGGTDEGPPNRTHPSPSVDHAVHGSRKPVKKRKLDSSLLTPSTPVGHTWSLRQMMRQRQQYFEEERDYGQRRKASHVEIPKACSTSVSENALETNNEVATAALQRVLKKEDFKRMEVLGQFNLGFIISKLDNDLYIIDQHASDEKYNYETLQQTTVMHQQPLVRPLLLELTAGEELVILDHLKVFAKNGFTFLVDKNAPATKKLKLLSMPFTKHTQFGTEDVRELASLLMDTPLNSSTIRLPKVMAMFASRACRSSIMIGTALHREEMQKIVRNLSGLDQPWNCPHGRPTLRHLVDLSHLGENNCNPDDISP